MGNAKTGGLYAMKTLKKSHVVERKQVAHVIAEKDILAEADNDWIVKLYYSFQVIEVWFRNSRRYAVQMDENLLQSFAVVAVH